MMIQARYCDGIRPLNHPATLSCTEAGIEIAVDLHESLPGQVSPPILWPFKDVRLVEAGAEVTLHHLVNGYDSGAQLRLEAEAFRKGFGPVLSQFGKGQSGEIPTRKIALWSGAAIASVLFLVFIGVPKAAQVLAPLVPFTWEERLGKAVEPQILPLFGNGKAPTFCGKPDGAGRAALDTMVIKLARHAELPGGLRVDIVNSPIVNAFALPGGRILLFRPVVQQANNPDEVAGVLAHEMGHVKNRDSMKAFIQDGALSLLVGLVTGDVTGGASLTLFGKFLLNATYSREAEREADQASVALMRAAGADSGAINLFFARMRLLEGRTSKDGALAMRVFGSHPITEERIQAVDQLTMEVKDMPKAPILTAQEWSALRRICEE